MEKLLFCVEKGIPAIYSAAPNAGASAPMTIAGQVTQGLSECLFGLVLTQLKKEGAPFIMGMGPAILDMITSQCLYNAPEYYLGYMAITEMSHYFDLPSWGYAGTSDSLIPDGQATMEGGYQTLLTALAGANLNHDVGYLNYGLTGCLEEILIQEEIISLVRRLMQGVPVNDDTLARDVIKEVGPMGDFLAHPHTLKHVRSTQWRPTLLNRLGYEQWAEAGHKSLLDRARERVEDILINHRPVPIQDEKQHAIQNLVDNFKI
jgi:trimethylamine--corrinoid protein Co-methyltransferase